MARSDTTPILPLDRYAKRMRINRYHFNNLDDGNHADACLDYWTQEDHDELAVEIENAETMLRDYASWDMGPVWRQERIPFNMPRRGGLPWWNRAIRPTFGKMIELGTRQKTLIEAGATVTFAGNTGSLSIVGTGGMDTEEIKVYYTTSDGAPAVSADAWQIRPLAVTIALGTATIVGHKSQFVLPSVVEDTSTNYPYDDAANYVDTVDVYRVHNDPELPLTLLWDVECADDVDSNSAQFGAGRIIDFETGRFEPRPATYVDSSHVWATPTYSSPPETIVTNYHAGNALRDDLNLEREIETAIMRLANVLMPCQPNDYCDLAAQLWSGDRAVPDILTESESVMPFGVQKGALYAFKVISRRALVGGGRL